MRSRFAMLLAIAAVCATTAFATWTSESLVTGSPAVLRGLSTGNNTHKVVFGTDGVGHLVWSGGPNSPPYPGVWYNRYNPGSGTRPGYWGADFAVAPYSPKEKLVHHMPSIALDADGRTFHVVWYKRPADPPYAPYGICYRRCTQDRRGSDKWGATQSLYMSQNGVDPVVACVPTEPNHVLVCWREGVDDGAGGFCLVTRLREYVNGAWTQVVRLDSNYMPSWRGGPAVAAAPNGDVFVAYSGYDQRLSPHSRVILVKARTSGVWEEPVIVTNSFLHCGSYAIEVNPVTNNPHLVFEAWTEVPNGAGLDTVGAVYHTYRNASGDWLTTPEAISGPRSYTSGYPGVYNDFAYSTMAFGSNGAAHVVWRDSSASYGIVYRNCSSEGGAWSSPEWPVSYDVYDRCARIAVEEPAHTIRLVWARGVGDDHSEIWWKSNYPGGGGSQAQPTALSQSRIELFPNPVKAGRVTVRYSLPRAEPLRATLLDVSGRALSRSEFQVTGSGTGSFALDASGLRAGVYVLKIESGASSLTRKFVIH